MPTLRQSWLAIPATLFAALPIPASPGNPPGDADSVLQGDPLLVAEKSHGDKRHQAPTPAAPGQSTRTPSTAGTGDPPEARVNPPSYPPPAPDLLPTKATLRKADALAAYVEGLLLQDEGEPDKAMAAFIRSLESDPGNIDLATIIAFEKGKAGQIDEAISFLKDAIKANPDSSDANLALAYFYLRYLRKPNAAEPYVRKALELDPDEATPHAYLIEIHLRTGDRKKADSVFNKVLKSKNPDPEFWLNLGALYSQLILKEDESPDPSDIAKANQFYERAAQLGRNNPTILSQVANYYVATQQLKVAIPLFIRVIELDPNTENETITAAREKLALSYIQTKDREQAIATLEALLRIDPDRRFAIELLAEVSLEAGNTARAIELHEKALRLNPNSPRHYQRLAELHLGPGKNSQRAVELLRDARTRFPDIPAFALLLGTALRLQKSFPEALTVFEEAEREGASGDPSVLGWQFYFEFGIAAEQAGDFEKAARLFKRSIELDPSQPDPYNYLGYMWVDRNENLDEAGELIRRAVDMRPDDAAYLDSLGWFYYRKGQYERALNELLRAGELLEIPDSVVLDHIGDTYEKLGQTREARDFWKKALDLDPTNSRIADKLGLKPRPTP